MREKRDKSGIFLREEPADALISFAVTWFMSRLDEERLERYAIGAGGGEGMDCEGVLGGFSKEVLMPSGGGAAFWDDDV